MKKRILLVALMAMLLVMAFAISVSAETPSMYIEFGAKFPGNDQYITVYTENAESSGNPQINFETKKFYSDIDFTQEVDMSTATGIDFSVAKSFVDGVQGNAPTRMTRATDPFVNCEEVKWFLSGMPTISYNSAFTFKGWTGLKYFDFGNATAIGDNVFENTGFETLTIPATITSLGGSAFYGCTQLKTVTIEGTITKFGNGSTFNGCTALETVNLEGALTTTGNNMFKDCKALTTVNSVNNFSTLTSVGSGTFHNCSALNITTFDLPKVTTIGSNAFRGMTKLVYVNAPLVTKISDNAFYDCTSLVNVTTTSDLKYIGQSAFQNCSNLKGPFDYSALTDLKTHAFYGCSSLILGDVNLSSLKSGGSSFTDCTGLTSIVFPEGITEIGGFLRCTNLKKVTVPSTVTKFVGNAFYGCTNLETVEFVYDYTKYPEHGSAFTTVSNGSVFRDCTSLETLIFPNSLTHVDNAAFSGCKNLKTLVLGASFATTNQSPAVPTSVTSLVLTPNYNMNGQLMGSKDKFTFPTSFVVYYTGTYEQAAALQTINTNVYEICKSTLVTYEEFTSPDFVRDENVHYLVCNYNKCLAFYNNVHPEKLEEGETDTNLCYLVECARCGMKNTYIGNDDTHKMSTVYAYANYFVNGTITSTCANEGCIYHGETPKVDNETLKPLFKELLYSTKEDGAAFGIYVEYKIDQNAIALYEELSDKTVNYGVMAIKTSNITGNGPLNVDGKTSATNVIAANVTASNLKTAKLIVTGNWEANASVEITMLGYVTDGEELHYMGSQTVEGEAVATTGAAAGAFNAVTYNNIIE